MAEDFDVIVVGAGPAGSGTAGLLALAGAKVLLLDKASFPRPKACGEYTSPETGAVLRRMGALSYVERARPRRVGAMKVIAPGGRSFNMDYRAGKPDAAVLATPRERLDAALLDYAVASGAEFRERTRVGDVLREDGKVVGVRAGHGAAEQEYRAPLVIGADGAHSVVAQQLGLTRPVRWPRKLGLVARYEGLSGCDDWGEMHVAEHGYCGLAPLQDGLINVGLVISLPGPDALRMPTTERYEAALAGFPLLAERLKSARRVTPIRGQGPVGVRAAANSGAGFMLVGDAAGFFDPFTGEGVHKALHGAELAAATARGALNSGDFSARALVSYSAARRREFLAKELVTRLVQVFVQFPPGMNYVTARLNRRPDESRILAAVLGDFLDARAALSPAYLWGLLRP